MGRLVVAVAATAALCVLAAPPRAFAQSPRASIEGDLDEDLRAAIAQAIGETDRPIQNRFDARRRFPDAARAVGARPHAGGERRRCNAERGRRVGVGVAVVEGVGDPDL